MRLRTIHLGGIRPRRSEQMRLTRTQLDRVTSPNKPTLICFDAAEDRLIQILPEAIDRGEPGLTEPFELIPQRGFIVLVTARMYLPLCGDFLDGLR